MIVLIAESKTMGSGNEINVSEEYYADHRPVWEDEAAEIMDRLRKMSTPDLISAVKISPAMAAKLRRMTYEFPDKSSGFKAIEAFTGVVFKNLDYSSLSPDGQDSVGSKVRIISSLYGWLKPADIIKPYRLEYSSPVAPDDKALSSYWRQPVTIRLVEELQQSGESEILDLLPADAAKCVDWKLVKRFAKVRKVDFKEQHGAALRSPHAGKLKAVRGRLLRNLIIHGMTDLRQLASFENESMMPIPDYPFSDRLAFYYDS